MLVKCALLYNCAVEVQMHSTNTFKNELTTCLKCILYSKTCVKWPLSKRLKIGFQDQLSLNAGQKYCRMPQVEHSAILLTFIKLPFVIKMFLLSLFEWPLYTGFTVILFCCYKHKNCTKYETYTILKVLTKCLSDISG